MRPRGRGAGAGGFGSLFSCEKLNYAVVSFLREKSSETKADALLTISTNDPWIIRVDREGRVEHRLGPTRLDRRVRLGHQLTCRRLAAAGQFRATPSSRRGAKLHEGRFLTLKCLGLLAPCQFIAAVRARAPALPSGSEVGSASAPRRPLGRLSRDDASHSRRDEVGGSGLAVTKLQEAAPKPLKSVA